MRIFLEFTKTQSPSQRARLGYAFRLFCAVYGHQPILESGDADTADVWISYSPSSDKSCFQKMLRLGSLYQARSPQQAAPPPVPFAHDNERTVLLCQPEFSAEPDWLGEIFEWVSCADEYSIGDRDFAGRLRFSASYVGRHSLSVDLPYAAIAMRLLQRALGRVAGRAMDHPVSPVRAVSHFVVNTHDVDFLPTGYTDSLYRLMRNAATSLILYKSPGLAVYQGSRTLTTALGGRNPLDQLPQLVRGETQRGINASYFFLMRRHHPRDGNYLVDHSILALMRRLEECGMEIGVHGSYTSLEQPGRLVSEFDSLRQKGFRPLGGRQHWLRFTLDRLIPCLEQAGVCYDASLGWSESVGFRAGACFAFPPYSFEHERPATFLEIPLVIMEGSLRRAGVKVTDSDRKVADLLALSRRYGWGGISLLWHPSAFGGGQLPIEIGDLYWRMVDKRAEWNDTWVSAGDFISLVRHRYIQVGLLAA